MKRIEDVYPKYSNELLSLFQDEYLDAVDRYLGSTHREDYEIKSMFDHDPLPDIEEGDDVICASLFFKPSSFRNRAHPPERDENGLILPSELDRAGHPAFGNSKRSQSTFYKAYVSPLLRSDFSGFRPILFLARDLACLRPTLEEAGIEVVMMHHSSIAHSPGAMWRYLGFNFPARTTYFLDTDRVFNRKRALAVIEILEADPRTVLARRLQRTYSTGQNPLILGNDFVVANAGIDFGVKESMLGYIAMHFALENRVTNFTFEPRHGRDEGRPRSSDPGYAGPRPRERVPKKCFPYYCFDEQWLKEVVYHHFSDGRMGTLVKNHDRDDLFQSLDLRHQLENGNLVWKEADKMPSPS